MCVYTCKYVFSTHFFHLFCNQQMLPYVLATINAAAANMGEQTSSQSGNFISLMRARIPHKIHGKHAITIMCSCHKHLEDHSPSYTHKWDF